MKTILLDGKALELAKGFSTRCKDLLERKKLLDAQMREIREAAEKDMLDTAEAIKKELKLADADGIQVDASYLDEHGHAYVMVHENMKGQNPLEGLFRHLMAEDDEPPQTLN